MWTGTVAEPGVGLGVAGAEEWISEAEQGLEGVEARCEARAEVARNTSVRKVSWGLLGCSNSPLATPCLPLHSPLRLSDGAG